MSRLYEIEITSRYAVVAESEEHALASYRVVFDDVPPDVVGLTPEQVLDQDAFDFLDELGRATYAGPEHAPTQTNSHATPKEV